MRGGWVAPGGLVAGRMTNRPPPRFDAREDPLPVILHHFDAGWRIVAHRRGDSAPRAQLSASPSSARRAAFRPLFRATTARAWSRSPRDERLARIWRSSAPGRGNRRHGPAERVSLPSIGTGAAHVHEAVDARCTCIAASEDTSLAAPERRARPAVRLDLLLSARALVRSRVKGVEGSPPSATTMTRRRWTTTCAR